MRSELAVDVLDHQPRHLVAKDVRVHSVGHRAQLGEMVPFEHLDRCPGLPHPVELETGVVLAPSKSSHHALRGGLGRSPRQGRHRDVDHLGSGLNAGHIRHRGHAAGAVRVDIDRDLDRLLQGRDQLPGRLRAEQT